MDSQQKFTISKKNSQFLARVDAIRFGPLANDNWSLLSLKVSLCL